MLVHCHNYVMYYICQDPPPVDNLMPARFIVEGFDQLISWEVSR